MSFVAVGIFTLFLGMLVWLFVRDRPADFGWPSPRETVQASAQTYRLPDSIRMVLTNRFFWPIAIWFFFECGIFFSFGGLWGGPYLIQVHGLPKEQAAHVLSMLAVGMIIGSPLLSSLSTSVFKARKPVIVMSSTVTLAIALILYYFTDSIPIIGLYLVCLGLGIFSSAIVVIGFTTNKELFPVEMAGTATGLVNLFPFAGGAVFQPILGHVLEAHGRSGGAFTLAGYQHAFQILLGCAAVALVASLFLKETMVRE